MNGLIVVNKPSNMTSRDVVNILTSLFGFKKIGHTGTLDPLASGVMLCLLGKYTKLGNTITSFNKEYIATVKMGIKTDTGDITGLIEEEKNFDVTEEKIKKTLGSWVKTYEQTVPKYSAVKVNGKKLYEYARSGEEVILPKRKVEIFEVQLLDFKGDSFTFRVRVSKGTYIRSLIEDICASLNTVGTMLSLIRISQGNFKIEDAYSLDDIKKGNYKLLNVKEFLDYPVIELDNENYKKVHNGCVIPNEYNIKDKVIFTYHNEDIAIYEVEKNILKSYVKLEK